MHASNAAEVDTAKRIFREGNAQDITSTGESAVPEGKDATGSGKDKVNRYGTTVIGTGSADAGATGRKASSPKE